MSRVIYHGLDNLVGRRCKAIFLIEVAKPILKRFRKIVCSVFCVLHICSTSCKKYCVILQLSPVRCTCGPRSYHMWGNKNVEYRCTT